MAHIVETLTGIVQRVTYHNQENGWSVLRVQPMNQLDCQETVTIHQAQVFAGATMEFRGAWTINKKHGRQFQATHAIEKKPATTASIEKYLGSGLIAGVGPKTAKKIVQYFKQDTLDIFEHHIERLTEVPGIAKKKLVAIETSWREHVAIKDVMMFLQQHGISTLFAVRIYKQYGDQSITVVKQNPYRLSHDIYGIGFFSADKIALSIGFSAHSEQRITAAIQHVLASSRDQGHCYLTWQQIQEGVQALIDMDLAESLTRYLDVMSKDHQLRTRQLNKDGVTMLGYYSKSLFYDEAIVAAQLRQRTSRLTVDRSRVLHWIQRYCQQHAIDLSDEQCYAVQHSVEYAFSILTGGPGCGKTTTTLVIVKLLEAMGKQVLLAAPTGRATQRMSEVVGREAKTIHRLLEWKGTAFQKNEQSPLQADFLIVDECSMLDISLAAALLKATPIACQILFIGDADQLPSIGAGNVLKDILSSDRMTCFRLTKVFRQAQQSSIVQYAHQINQGKIPSIPSPFKTPSVWKEGFDCLFMDSDEATQDQMAFIARVNRFFDWKTAELEQLTADHGEPYQFRAQETIVSAYEQAFTVPKKFEHVSLDNVHQADKPMDAFKAIIKKIHPWSSLHYELSCVDVVVKLYLHWIPKYFGNVEIQVLTPMTRGSLGSANVNTVIQQRLNPPAQHKAQITIGGRMLREGDRVIHKRNNYDLNVFNGDIGQITHMDRENLTCVVSMYPDGRTITYTKEAMMELDLAYAITIHKSQGSEFSVVIIPILTQHFNMLYRNLIYTGLTRAKTLAVFVGTRKALSMAVRKQDNSQRQTALTALINDDSHTAVSACS